MSTDQNLISYYQARAAEYEKIYSKPERQEDLKKAFIILQDLFSGKSVCEVACGTGFWTEQISKTAKSIHASDINGAVIEIAKSKHYACPTCFEIADLNNLKPGTKFDGVFGGFIWSHILLQDLDVFIDKIKALVSPGGIIVFMDNKFVEGSNHPITRMDEDGNTFQTRRLEDGSSHEVLKNFPNTDFLKQTLSSSGIEVEIINLTYFWIARLKVLCYA